MSVDKAVNYFKAKLNEREMYAALKFDEFLKIASQRPNNVFRNIFQLFADMVHHFVHSGIDEYPNDPESINYVKYDTRQLFVEGTNTPFLADRPFANRLVNLARSFRGGAQRNRIFIFEGPTGSGKSTFLNNLLLKFEDYTNADEGATYEILWKIDTSLIGGYKHRHEQSGLPKSEGGIGLDHEEYDLINEMQRFLSSNEPLEVPCPSHDNPILIIPREYRAKFIDDLIDDNEFKDRIFNRTEYDWVFKDELCTICTSLYQTLTDRLESPADIFKMIYVKKIQFNRRLGEGISVYNPGDEVQKQANTNPVLQKLLNNLFRDSNAVRYVFSNLARTNNGINAIMDIKDHNKQRIMNLHGIISDSVHKVEHIEEKVTSLFIALMNPEDKDVIESVKSLGDRIQRIPIPYVLDYNTEVEIYRLKFGKDIDHAFLPQVLENFAKVVLSSRLRKKSENISEWIPDPQKYAKYCDRDLLLLKMDIYTGIIPSWLSDEDRKAFDAKRRRKVIGESAHDGLDENSISGRKSIELFNEFYSRYTKDRAIIDMAKVYDFFKAKQHEYPTIPEGFLDSLVTLYNYNVLEEIKESLYDYNEREISKDVLNYMFATNFETGSTATCIYTGMELHITEELFRRFEDRLVREKDPGTRSRFRSYVQKEYTTTTLTQEIGIDKKGIKETALYQLLFEKYQFNIKDNVLIPFLENDNFRNAIKDYGNSEFKSYDKKIIHDVRFLIRNLVRKYYYTEDGARQVCIYVMDNNIPQKFSER